MNKIATLIHTKHPTQNGTIPQILILNQEAPILCHLTYKFNLKLMEQKYSYRTITDSTIAIGLLIDYYYLVFKVSNPSPYKDANFFFDLVKSRLKQDVLNWHNLSFKQAIQQKKHLERFASWLKYHSHYADNELSLLIKKSYDFYLTKESIRIQIPGIQEHSQFLRTFPEDKIQPLLESTKNLSFRIAFLLMLNGRRASEVLNLFVSDIQIYNENLRVYLAHPETSYYKWNSKIGTREEFLRDKFKLTPRTKLVSSKLTLGWRGMKFADPIRQVSEVHFIMNTDKLLLQWHQEYVSKVRRHIKTHPYYLVNEDGQPIPLKILQIRFKEACARIGLSHSRELGTTLNGLRHFYGKYCYNLKIDPLMISEMLSSPKAFNTLKFEKEDKMISLAKKLAIKG